MHSKKEVYQILEKGNNLMSCLFNNCAYLQGLEEVQVHSKKEVYQILEKGKESKNLVSCLFNTVITCRAWRRCRCTARKRSIRSWRRETIS